MPYTADSLDIQYVLGADGVSASITGNEDFREGETKNVVIVVTNKSGTITHYTLSVTKERNPANTILAMHMSEWSDAGLDNSVTVQAGKTYTFTVQWKYVQGTEPVFFLDGTALDGRKILVRADTVQPEVSYVEEGDKLSYTFTAKGDRLQMSALMGGEGNTHLRDIYFANPTLYESDENGNPVAGGDVVDCDPDFDEAWIKWSYGGDYRKVVEVDKDFFHRVFPNALTSLDVGYTLSDPFDYRRNYYEITVPYHVDQLQIAYTLADGASLSGITGNGGFVEGASTDVVIAVNNDAGGVSAYTIRVYREREPAASLTSLDVGYALTPPFDPQILAYTLSVPNEVEQLDVHYTTAANTTFISLEGNTGLRVGVPQDVTITVANTKGYEQTYTITVTREGAQGDTSPMENALGSVLATLTCTNATTREDLDKALKDGLASSNYTVTVSEFYKLAAVSAVRDNFGVIIPGENGYITAVVTMTDGQQVARLPIKLTIQAPVKEYTFTEEEVSKESDFELEDNGKVLTLYSGTAKKVVIPDGVEEIVFGWNDAWDLEDIQVLVIPDSVKVIPPQLCFGMTNVEAVYVGDGITELSERAFERCLFLQYIRLPGGLKVIDNYALAATCSLTQLRLPQGLEEIRDGAFRFSLIRDITIPASVETIGKYAFRDCFNAAFQLVAGSDNVYMTYPFGSSEDPRIDKLQAISDAVVDYTIWKNNPEDWTWDTLWSMCDTFLKANGNGSDYFGITGLNETYAACFGGCFWYYDYQSGKAVSMINSQETVKRYEILIDAISKRLAAGASDPVQFETGKILFSCGYSSATEKDNGAYTTLIASDNLGVVPVPTNSTKQPLFEYSAYGIPVGAKNAEAVPYFLRYVFSPEGNDLDNFYINDQAREVIEYVSYQDNTFFGSGYTYEIWQKLLSGNSSQVKSVLDSYAGVMQQNVDDANAAIAKLP